MHPSTKMKPGPSGPSFKQQATSNKQQATSNKQQATSNKQQATSNMRQSVQFKKNLKSL
jgi:hypothetical protein